MSEFDPSAPTPVGFEAITISDTTLERGEQNIFSRSGINMVISPHAYAIVIRSPIEGLEAAAALDGLKSLANLVANDIRQDDLRVISFGDIPATMPNAIAFASEHLSRDDLEEGRRETVEAVNLILAKLKSPYSL